MNHPKDCVISPKNVGSDRDLSRVLGIFFPARVKILTFLTCLRAPSRSSTEKVGFNNRYAPQGKDIHLI